MKIFCQLMAKKNNFFTNQKSETSSVSKTNAFHSLYELSIK